MKKTKSGFTIVELLLVIVIIAILASIITVSYNSVQAKARDQRRKTDIANITKALEQYYQDNGSYPVANGSSGSSVNGSWYTSDTATWTSAFGSTLVAAKTIDSLPVDPKNNTGNVTSSNVTNYAYYGNLNGYCGTTSGQMYVLVYRYESIAKEKKSDGICTTNPLNADSFFGSGASYFMVTKNGS